MPEESRAISADQPTRPEPRRLPEHQGLPGEFLVAFTEGLMDRREQLIRLGQPPQAARELAVTEAVQAFRTGAAQRGWTVAERRIASLASDTLGLEQEYRDRHGYEPELARLYAVCEVLEGERAREAIPLPWRRLAADPPPAARPRPPATPPIRADTTGRPPERPDAGARR